MAVLVLTDRHGFLLDIGVRVMTTSGTIASVPIVYLLTQIRVILELSEL